MSERIDHVAVAIKIIHDVSNDERGPVPLELFDPIQQWVYDASMQEAQVHATLALVEQQRIANLIALHRHEVEYDIGDWSRLYYDAGDGPALFDSIREGLSL